MDQSSEKYRTIITDAVDHQPFSLNKDGSIFRKQNICMSVLRCVNSYFNHKV